MAIRDWLGKDTQCPINGGFVSVEGVSEVNQCIQLLIATVPGERVMRPTYGCRLFTRLWSNIDDVASEGLKDIRDAIDQFEPRVDLISLGARIDRDTGLVTFYVQYNIIDQNVVENLVFPFATQLTE